MQTRYHQDASHNRIKKNPTEGASTFDPLTDSDFTSKNENLHLDWMQFLFPTFHIITN